MKILSIAPTGYVSFSSNKTKPTSKQNKKDDIEKAKSFQNETQYISVSRIIKMVNIAAAFRMKDSFLMFTRMHCGLQCILIWYQLGFQSMTVSCVMGVAKSKFQLPEAVGCSLGISALPFLETIWVAKVTPL